MVYNRYSFQELTCINCIAGAGAMPFSPSHDPMTLAFVYMLNDHRCKKLNGRFVLGMSPGYTLIIASMGYC